MNVAEALGPAISEPLSWVEICERYPDQHVCVVEVDLIRPGGLHFHTARVAGHGQTRRQAFEQAAPWWAQHSVIGHYFTGQVALNYIRPNIILDDETRNALRYRR